MQLPDAQPLSAIAPTSYEILVYGKSGTGKTEFGGTWAEAGQVLFVDTDDGTTTLRTSNRLQHKDNIFVVPIKEPNTSNPVAWLHVKGIFEYLLKHGTYTLANGVVIKPRTVVVDSLTTASAYALNRVLLENRHLDQQPTQPDWGKLRSELIKLISFGRALSNINFILICHEKYLKNELSGQVWCLPAVVGQLSQEISLFFDEVYHAETHHAGGQVKYTLLTKSSGLVTAKSRLDLTTEIPTHANSILSVINSLQPTKGASE